jgi:hypothetical protein
VAVAERSFRDPGSLDCLIVDAGTNDATLSMSCPPAPFLEPGFLRDAFKLLQPHGVLVVNCVTRSQATFNAAFEAVQVGKRRFESGGGL